MAVSKPSSSSWESAQRTISRTSAGSSVSVTLQPESVALAQALDARFDELRKTLEQAGVPVGKLTCARSDLFDPGRTGSWLVNLRA